MIGVFDGHGLCVENLSFGKLSLCSFCVDALRWDLADFTNEPNIILMLLVQFGAGLAFRFSQSRRRPCRSTAVSNYTATNV